MRCLLQEGYRGRIASGTQFSYEKEKENRLLEKLLLRVSVWISASCGWLRSFYVFVGF